MAYTALYRKWRPITFDDVVGQEHITNTLKNEIETGRIGHAYLFCGSRGTGKTSTARILSRAINCESPVNGNPCNECENCRGILEGRIPDISELDAASNNGVDNIRDLREEARFSGSSLSDKVYIVDEVHMLTNQAFNALLKILEEPPAHVHFILATTEAHKIPQTILSRCQRFDFRRITVTGIEEQIKKILASGDTAVEDRAIRLIAEKADGSMRDALSLLDQCISIGGEQVSYEDVSAFFGADDKNAVFELFESIIECDVRKAFGHINDMVEKGINITSLTDDFLALLRNMLVAMNSENAALALGIAEEDAEEIKALSKKLDVTRLVQLIKETTNAQALFRTSINPRLTFETAVVKMANPVFDTSAEGLLARISVLEDKIASGGFVKAEKDTTEKSDKPAAQKKTEVKKVRADSALLKRIKTSWSDIVGMLYSTNNMSLAIAVSEVELEEEDGKIILVFDSQDAYILHKEVLLEQADTLAAAIVSSVGKCAEISVKVIDEKQSGTDNLIKLYNENKD